MPRAIEYPCTLTIYRFVGDKAFVHHETQFDALPRAAMIEALNATRAGLPPDFGATLVDATGHDIRPEALR